MGENIIFLKVMPNADKKQLSREGKKIVLNKAEEYFGKGFNGELGTMENGKPYFVNHPDLHFNISHCENAVAVAFGEKPLGVDIENIRAANLKIAHRFFTRAEIESIHSDKDFFYVWTRKEAVIKRSGKGLATPLNSFSVLESSEIKTLITENFVISLCSENAGDFKLI